jgi:hypothetical protein
VTIWFVAVLIILLVYLPIALFYKSWDRRGLPFRKSEPFVLVYAVVIAIPIFTWVGKARGWLLLTSLIGMLIFAKIVFQSWLYLIDRARDDRPK